jgi:hypothetical protein
MANSMSGSSDTASKIRLKTSAFTQSRKRLNTVFHFPNSGGKSRHGLPVRAIHNTASRKQATIATRAAGVGHLAFAMRLHLGPLGIRQAHAIQENLLSELDSQTTQPVNPNSQQTLERQIAELDAEIARQIT